MKKILLYFIQGLLFVAPIALTIYIIYFTFITIDGWLATLLKSIFGKNIPGLGILILFVSITFLGVFGQFTIVKPFKTFLKNLLHKIPMLNLLYSSLRDMLSAFVGKEKKFNTPVKVCINKENNLYKIGFITKNSMEEIDEPNLVSVYFPHSYNFSGELYLLPKDSIEKLSISSSQAMKFIVSGGITNIDKD